MTEPIWLDDVADDAIILQLSADDFPGKLLNANDARRNSGKRWYWARIRAWRNAAAWLARAAMLQPVPPPVRADVWFRFPTNQRRDVQNYQATCKALVDGLADAGVITGDHDGVFEGPYAHRHYPNGPHHIAVVLTPLAAKP